MIRYVCALCSLVWVALGGICSNPLNGTVSATIPFTCASFTEEGGQIDYHWMTPITVSQPLLVTAIGYIKCSPCPNVAVIQIYNSTLSLLPYSVCNGTAMTSSTNDGTYTIMLCNYTTFTLPAGAYYLDKYGDDCSCTLENFSGGTLYETTTVKPPSLNGVATNPGSTEPIFLYATVAPPSPPPLPSPLPPTPSNTAPSPLPPTPTNATSPTAPTPVASPVATPVLTVPGTVTVATTASLVGASPSLVASSIYAAAGCAGGYGITFVPLSNQSAAVNLLVFVAIIAVAAIASLSASSANCLQLFPHWTLVAIDYSIGGLALNVGRVRSENILLFFLGITTLALVLACEVWVLYRIRSHEDVYKCRQPDEAASYGNVVTGKFSVLWCSNSSDIDVCGNYGYIFTCVRVVWWRPMQVFFFSTCSLICGLATTSCNTIQFTLIAYTALLLLAFIVIRPYNSHVQNVLRCAGTLCGLLVAIAPLVQALHRAYEAISIVACVVALVVSIHGLYCSRRYNAAVNHLQHESDSDLEEYDDTHNTLKSALPQTSLPSPVGDRYSAPPVFPQQTYF